MWRTDGGDVLRAGAVNVEYVPEGMRRSRGGRGSSVAT